MRGARLAAALACAWALVPASAQAAGCAERLHWTSDGRGEPRAIRARGPDRAARLRSIGQPRAAQGTVQHCPPRSPDRGPPSTCRGRHQRLLLWAGSAGSRERCGSVPRYRRRTDPVAERLSRPSRSGVRRDRHKAAAVVARRPMDRLSATGRRADPAVGRRGGRRHRAAACHRRARCAPLRLVRGRRGAGL